VQDRIKKDQKPYKKIKGGYLWKGKHFYYRAKKNGDKKIRFYRKWYK